jgi:hypothetical protein
VNRFFGEIPLVKSLDEMSFEELGRMFPIILSEYNPTWPTLYSAEKALIERTVGRNNIARISYYGSTSIPGINETNLNNLSGIGRRPSESR